MDTKLKTLPVFDRLIVLLISAMLRQNLFDLRIINYLRILFEEKFFELLGISASELVDALPCKVDSLYKKFYEKSACVRLRRSKPNAYYSIARAVFDECTVSSLLAY